MAEGTRTSLPVVQVRGKKEYKIVVEYVRSLLCFRAGACLLRASRVAGDTRSVQNVYSFGLFFSGGGGRVAHLSSIRLFSRISDRMHPDVKLAGHSSYPL